MTTRLLARRLAAVERKANEGGLRVVVQPAELKGDALVDWENKSIPADTSACLVVLIRRFGVEHP